MSSVLFNAAHAVQTIADLLPKTVVGSMTVREEGSTPAHLPWFEHQTYDYPCGLRCHTIYLGGVEIIYDPPSVHRHPDLFLRRAAAT